MFDFEHILLFLQLNIQLRSYPPVSTETHPNLEVKLARASLVSGWETASETGVL